MKIEDLDRISKIGKLMSLKDIAPSSFSFYNAATFKKQCALKS